MKKLIIDVYAVTDQLVYDDEGRVMPIGQVFEKIVDQIKISYMKSKVELNLIDVLKDNYDEALAQDNLSQGFLLPWTYFNGELEFYNGFSESMIVKEAMNQMKYKIVKK